MNQTRHIRHIREHGRSALPTNSAPRSAADSQTRPMSTEEYLRTEVFGDQNRMQQKRMANLAQLERRAEDTPISMEEYVRHIVYAQDLPDAAACAPVAQHAIPVVMPRPMPAVAARAAVPYATPDTGHTASGTALQAVAVPNNRNSASVPRYAGATATGLGSCCVVLPGIRHGGSAVGSATQPAVLSGMQPDTQPDTQPPRLNVRLQRNAQGRIIRKLEGAGDSMREYCFAYDAQGHLTHAWLNGSLVEQYAYNEAGQRVADETVWRGPRSLAYDRAGRLVQAGNVRCEYTPEGSLCSRIRTTRHGEEITSFAYGADTRLDSVVLPDGTQITYYYGSALGPAEKHVNGVLAESYIWKDALRLGAWIDHASGTRCLFHYEAGHSPAAVTMEHPQGAATYRLGFDQIGSLKLVVLPDANGGKLIKEMAYDSFGTMLNDSNPELFLPVGFASGLVDRHTGLIRFGYRDYSPELGRFTALDPARDTRGDGDLWDYCVDDPINCVDPWGLFRFGVRSLDGFTSVSRPGFTSPMPDSGVAHGWIDGMNNPGEYNLQLHHEQGFYEDEKGGDIGHGKEGPMVNESNRKNEYRLDPKSYDDNIMRQSQKITIPGQYNIISNNCQDYADRLRDNYEILKESPEIRRQIEKEKRSNE